MKTSLHKHAQELTPEEKVKNPKTETTKITSREGGGARSLGTTATSPKTWTKTESIREMAGKFLANCLLHTRGEAVLPPPLVCKCVKVPV